MTLKSRQRIAVFIIAVLGICLLGIGTVAAQSNAPAPTPSPGGENLSPLAPSENGDLPFLAADTDDSRVISNGKTLTGKINPSTDKDWYYFYATQGQQVTIKMIAKNASLDGYMELYSVQDDQLRASDDDSGGNRNPLIYQYTLPRSGRFKIQLTSWNNASTGYYTIRLDVIGGDVDDNRLLATGKTMIGKILPASDVDSYFFQAMEGQKATIQMNKYGSSVDSYLLLYDPANNLIATNDDSGGNRNALISNLTLTTSGAYRIDAQSYNNSSSGAYKVKLNLTKPNLALNKASTAWNWHAPWYLPQYGNDGDQGSRWAGDYGTNWWWVDLGSRRTFSQVKINWEAAFATEYFVGWSDAPNCIGTYTGFNYTASSAGWKTHNLSSRTARCVAIRMDTAVWWATNYSFWEFEVYNMVSNATSAPVDSPNSILVDVLPSPDFSDSELIEIELTGPTMQR